ncbi:hypothetical protein EJ05DRAFT_503265 [Pseudovirgaria hyperparasitica]|uniref:Uncharacterized protein n=1 Tax=Pseudovirgaria hyperparasitica TaxID=470096 RepID=A0A6A6VW77_9PEZI|nr:uncharacterized protein EJ05DRAFT_503265 [Pseudovirgaria hyperparasitica]KAF2754948.1 hypothetical protein EJ05DRAFT_503265 [Pseudovirgaria hyperparasitica]
MSKARNSNRDNLDARHSEDLKEPLYAKTAHFPPPRSASEGSATQLRACSWTSKGNIPFLLTGLGSRACDYIFSWQTENCCSPSVTKLQL